MKLRVKLALGAIFIILLGCILALTSHNGSKSALEKYQRELRAKGEKFTYQELLPANPPPTPEAAKIFSNTNSIFVYISNTARMMRFVAPGKALVSHQQPEFLDSDGTNVWPALTAEMETNRPALLQLREALQVPALFYNLDYSQGYKLPLPHLARLKPAENLATYSSLVALRERNFPEAWTNLISAVALVQLYQAEPVEISHLVKIAMANLVLSVSWEALQSDQWTDEQLSDLQARWQKIDLFGPTETAFSMERAFADDTFTLTRKSYAARADILALPASGAVTPPDDLLDLLKATIDRYPRYWIWKLSWSYQEQLYNTKIIQAILENCRATRSTGAFAPALKEYRNKIGDLNKQMAEARPHFIFVQSDGTYSSSLIKFANAENARRMLVTAIALKRHQLRNGKYPPDLNALIPEFLEKIPTDLMDGKPLRYQLKPDGEFLLYSVGEDGEDNHGDATPTDSGFKYKNWLKGRDAVWPHPATPEEITTYQTNSPLKSP